MDRIIELIIIFYVISAFLRFLKKSQKSKDQSYPFPRPRPAPPPQPPTGREEPIPYPARREEPKPYPSSRKVLEQAPGPVFTPKERDALDILAEWERRAKGQRAGTQREGTAEPEVSSRQGVEAQPRRKVEVSTMKGPMKRPDLETARGQVIRPFQSAMPRVGEEVKPLPSAELQICTEEVTEGEILFFSNPAMLWQGIVMSEILRAPLSRRDPFLLPYLRG